MLKNIIYLFAVSLILLGCKTSKPLSGKVSKDVSVRQLTKIHEKSFPAIKTLQARLRGSYTSKEESQSIAISARIEKDKAIWLSAKLAGIIPLAKVYITPNRVQYYEKIAQLAYHLLKKHPLDVITLFYLSDMYLCTEQPRESLKLLKYITMILNAASNIKNPRISSGSSSTNNQSYPYQINSVFYS